MLKQLHTTLLLLSLLLLQGLQSSAQYKISGKVIDDKQKPVRGASVYLDNTIDGATADSMGYFSFTTTEQGNQTIVASELTHTTAGMPLVIAGDIKDIVLVLKANKANDLDAVVITAGAFDASNDKGKTVLKPLDIVTTAGANADVVKALQTLPGTQQTGPDNGLFVRGGDANEAAVIVDGMVVQNAFFSGAPGVATRSRFGAFQYQGVSFSSGGYSARYGQALSGVLELNTVDLPEKSNVNLGINMGGIYASAVKKWKKSSIEGGGGYNNLTPFFSLVNTNFKFYKVPQGGSGNVRYVWKPTKTSILKASANMTQNSTGVGVPNPSSGDSSTFNPFAGQPDTVNFLTNDLNIYSNISYKNYIKNKYQIYAAASVSHNTTKNSFGQIPLDQYEYRQQARLEIKDYLNSRLNVMVGTDVQSFGQKREFNKVWTQQFDEVLTGAYTELEWTPVNRIAVKPGLRYEHSTLLNTGQIAPRLSMAIKTGVHSQASLAGGMFYQNAANIYLMAGLKPQMQQAIHYIANWQWSHDNRTLRLEAYRKDYKNLVLEQVTFFDPNGYRNINPSTIFNNGGFGYAQGAELFWRDKQTVKNLDYWVSYSLIDTRRKYANFLTSATPTFIAQHNANLVGKYFVDKIKTSISATYSFATGRPYYNPEYDYAKNPEKFMSDLTPEFHNLALSAAYLHSFGKWFTVFYISVDNVTKQRNVFGYRYGADASGKIVKNEIVPALYRTLFFGVNMSLSEFKKDEL
jgi:hypothetical protein